MGQGLSLLAFTYFSIYNLSCFSDFVFNIKLKIPVLYFNSQPTDSQSGVIVITPTEPTVSGRQKIFQ